MPGVAADIVIRMRAAGVRMIFGLPGGGGNLDIVDAAASAELPFVLTATETGSAIAALAQAEVTGAPGACITTLGPGVASVVNGVGGVTVKFGAAQPEAFGGPDHSCAALA